MSTEDREPADERTADYFAVAVGDITLSKGSTVAHADYSPLTLTRVTISAFGKRADVELDGEEREFPLLALTPSGGSARAIVLAPRVSDEPANPTDAEELVTVEGGDGE